MRFQPEDLPELSSQRVLVTGASGNLGAAVAAVFVQRGAAVTVHVRDNKQAPGALKRVSQLATKWSQNSRQNVADQPRCAMPQTEFSGRIYSVSGDLTAHAVPELAVTEAFELMGSLTGIVNCAGVQNIDNFADIDASAWNRVFESNVTTAHELTRSAAKVMAAGSWITHISSIEGLRPAAGHAHYAASKAALTMYAKAAALELGGQGIRVNAISPGLIERPGIEMQWPEGVISWQGSAPLSRLVAASEVAAAAAMLASPAAAAITGQNLAVDCGMTATPGW